MTVISFLMNVPPPSTGQVAVRRGDRPEKRALPLLFVTILAAVIWLPRLNDALFVDEAASFWLIEHDLAEVVRLTLSLTGQSWFYTVLLAFWTSVFGTSEISLRLPSILGALATCALLIRIGRERGIASPMPAGAVLALTPLMTFAATVARPYALGLFFSVLSIASLQSWTHRGRTGGLYAAVAASLCALYCHYTFIAIAIPLVLVVSENKDCAHHWKALLKASLLALVGSIPPVLALMNISPEQVSDVAILEELPSAAGLGMHFVSTPIILAVALILALKITVYRRPKGAKIGLLSHDERSWHCLSPAPWSELRFGLTLYLAPKLVTLLAAIAVNPTLLVPRYSVLSTVGEAYTVSVLFAAIRSRFWRICLSGVAIATMLLPHLTASPPDTAWRPIVEQAHEIAARNNCTFFALVGFAETKRVSLLTKEPTQSFILSPLRYYKLEPAVLLPASADSPQEQEYMSTMVYPKIPSRACNVMLEWHVVDSHPATVSGPQALANQFILRGCTKSAHASSGLVTLSHWECGRPS